MGTPTALSQDAEGTTFVAEPVPGSQTAPDGGYFLIDATPGETVRQAIGLRNDSDEQLVLQLAAVDATTGQLGGASYGLPDEPLTRMGTWIELERSTVTLEPGASEIVSFEVAVPSDPAGGTHLAGLSIAVPVQRGEEADAGEGEAGASIDVQTRHIIAVQVDLPGPSDPELVVDGVSPATRPDGLYLEIAIENRGHGLTKAGGVITVDDDFEHQFDIDTFVPGTEIAYPVKWRTDAEEGEYSASVEVRYGDEVARWDGEFRVGEATLDELAERQVTTPEQDTDSGLPMAVVAGAALAGAALLGGGGYVLARRRRPVGKHSA